MECCSGFTEDVFNKELFRLRNVNPAAVKWLMEIGVERWSLCHSPWSRFGTLTSDYVESINAALMGIRKLPI